ncbi:MAG: RbsD/FucU domain-containing protein [Eubacteriales bacterium]|nr:RbsD/FucU domain-containing protein [Eubacteriales bacterium]
MLRNIPKILPPELVKCMMEMGHSDKLILADANFPGTAHAQYIIRMDSVEIPELLEAILPFFPLDNFVPNPVKLMRNLPTEPVPEIWETYRTLLKKYDTDHAFQDFEFIDRLPFYEDAENAFVIVQTGDTARYANIILQKGVC